MHDAKGRELNVGDTVMVPFKVTSVSPGVEFCNIGVETIGGRLPDGDKTFIWTLNTKQVLRANEGDDISIVTMKQDGKTFLT